MAVNFDAKNLGRALGKMSQEQARIQENIYPDDPDAQLLLQIPSKVSLTGTVIGAALLYPTDSFILDHPVYGSLDSSTLLLDGGYAAAVDTSIGLPYNSSRNAAISANHYFAQSITPSAGLIVDAVSITMDKIGTPTAPVVVRIETDGTNGPSGNLVSAFATASRDVSTISGIALYEFTFSRPVSLAAGTKYYIVVRPSYFGSSENTAYYSNTSNIFSLGERWLTSNAGSTWSSSSTNDVSMTLSGVSGSVLFSTTL